MNKELKIYLIVLLLSFTFILCRAQSPNQFSYQAILRNTGNELLLNQNVGVKFSILTGSPTGTLVYSETHSTTTNSNGLITVQIGSGTVMSGAFPSTWVSGPYYIKTETDPTGGTNYILSGTSQLLSVPFALHAKTSSDNNWNKTGNNINNTNSGKVGIGTSSPNNPLHVLGTNSDFDAAKFETSHTAGTGISINNLASGGRNYSLISTANAASEGRGKLLFKDNAASSVRMVIDSNGNIGIGNTNPKTALDFANVLDNRRLALYTDADNDHQFNGFGINSSILRYQIAATSGNHVFYAGNSSTASNELMRIKGNGSVLIGTSIESEQLTVAKGITIDALNSNNGTVTANAIRFGSGNTGEGILSRRTSGTNQFGLDFLTGHSSRLSIDNNGNVMVGTQTAANGYKFTVNGKIICTELRVQLTPFPDYVFEDDYQLLPLNLVELFIKNNKHLPGMPSAEEVEKGDIGVGEIERKLVEKIEELTLHLIQQEKEIENLKEKLEIKLINKN